MRSKIVFVLLVGMLGGTGALLGTRVRSEHKAPAEKPENGSVATTAPSGSASAGAPVASASASSIAAPQGSASAGAMPASSQSAPPADAGAPPLFDRPLKVISLGWELAAPGFLANEGPKPGEKSAFSAAGLDVRLAVTDGMGAIEAALARGGGDSDGADVAIVPLPTFVSAYERLRALSPEVFFVVGFSRGREAFAAKDGLPTGPVKGDVTLAATAASPSAFLGLFLLDIAGVPPSQVKIVAPTSREEKDAPFLAFDRSENGSDGVGSRKIVLTTADAPKLVPLVAIAPHGLVTEKERAMTVFARGWLDGIKKLASDPPGGARQVASAQGAPEPLVLMRKLGDVEAATLDENARLAGLSGRGALTLGALFGRTWQLYRGASLLATPPPEAPPIATGVISSLVRTSVGVGAPAPAAKIEEGKKALVVYRQEKLDEEALVDTLGLLAAAFERSVIRVAVNAAAGGIDEKKTKKVIEAAEGRFDVRPGRLVASKKSGVRGTAVVNAVVEVMALP